MTTRRQIAIVTTSRADFGIYLPLIESLKASPTVDLTLIASGMHLREEFGDTIAEVRSVGVELIEVEALEAGDQPEDIARSMGRTTTAFARTFAQYSFDMLVVLGDRFEMFAAAVAAVPFGLPIAHLHGGESTVGAFDEQLRHALTKMSHLHFCATETYRDRVIQLGEHPDRVFCVGALALDHLAGFEATPREQLSRQLDLDLSTAPIIVTFHPETHNTEGAQEQVDHLLAALGERPEPKIVTAPNADTSQTILRRAIEAFANSRADTVFVESLGFHNYFSVLGIAACMVGNSSSGIIEAASFGLPVVNIGRRQEGRVRGANVIDTVGNSQAISAAIERATSADFRAMANQTRNPYDRGGAAAIIVDVLTSVPLGPELTMKRFYNLGVR